MQPDPRLNELLTRWSKLHQQGAAVTVAELCSDCPELIEELTAQIRTQPTTDGPCDEPVGAESGGPLPTRLGRYAVKDRVGAGGFGTVYRAYDEELHRWVAIKVPHLARVSTPEGIQEFLREARQVARLDHPNILAVYDVGQVANHAYIVYKLIEGPNLATRRHQSPLAHSDTALLVAQIADALDYAHRQGLYHRDIKPANILLDQGGNPHIADFGLAVREAELIEPGNRRAGTLPYMSPEQVRGEGHRIDGRTDIYSLGVVLYELLTGRRAFEGNSKQDVADQILHREVRPPRQLSESIPRELERICLKAMSKRVTDRYTAARDMAEDLRLAAKPCRVAAGGPDAAPIQSSVEVSVAAQIDSHREPVSELPVRVVPRGLRSFGAEDSDFYLELLPGPRNRQGIPDVVQHWLGHLASLDPQQTFAVGMIYGPSGGGKSSLMKAGLLPRLAHSVLAVYVEATRDDTEVRLVTALRKLCPTLPPDRSLVDYLTALRRGQVLPRAQKVLIVLDQFEQWLQAQADYDDAELLLALRQCDGEHVQCIVMVRDDFWVAISRFMRSLEVRLVEGHNIALVDLFDPRHARKVLAAFGQAFGSLPENLSDLSAEQQRFLDQAVAAISRDGEIIPVQLSLFAEMLRAKPWLPNTLRKVRGVEGLGVAFLEEAFSGRSANPQHRVHQAAARMVLEALLPDSSHTIKGRTRSYSELLQVSGYGEHFQDFEALLTILDRELRLITPVEASEPSSARGPDALRYQLSHDYLVAPLREWLTQKRRETARGRAELRLADRANLWAVQRQPRQLPTLWEWCNILLLTHSGRWNDGERSMVRAASRHHAVRVLSTIVIVATLSVAAFAVRRPDHYSADLVDRLLDADVTQVPAIIERMQGYRRWVNPRLKQVLQTEPANERHRLHARMALLDQDESQVPHLLEQMLQSPPDEFLVIRGCLFPHRARLKHELWKLADDPNADPDRAFQAASALALYFPDDERWSHLCERTVNQLVAKNLLQVDAWASALHPVRESCIIPLKQVFVDQDKPTERFAAALALAIYLADQPESLIELLLRGDARQVRVLTRSLADHRAIAVSLLTRHLNEAAAPSGDAIHSDDWARGRANSAAALLLLGDRSGWSLLAHAPDPQARSYLVHELAPAGVTLRDVIDRLREEHDVSIRRALILSLGDYEAMINPEQRRDLIDEMLFTYRDDPDPGVHGATDWLLRRWKQQDQIGAIDEVLIAHANSDDVGRLWYINSQRQTMTIVHAPVSFIMGSPPDEPGRAREKSNEELPHRVEISKSFAIGAKEVTVREFLNLMPEFGDKYSNRFSPHDDCPMNSVNLADVAEYCRRLSDVERIEEDSLRYRLPREEEWEYACRAQSETSRFYGQSEALLPAYAWYKRLFPVETRPVGELKPNDLGLFDVYGNVLEWCQDSPLEPVELEDRYQKFPSPTAPRRYVRGGGVSSHPSVVRSAFRSSVLSSRDMSNGFRVARGLP